MRAYWSLLLMSILATGCQQSIGNSPRPAETTEAAFNIDGNPTVEFEVPGISCEGCVAAVCGALAEVPGVVDAKGDHKTKTITIAVDEAVFDAAMAEEAIEAAKGEASLTSAPDSSTPSDDPAAQ